MWVFPSLNKPIEVEMIMKLSMVKPWEGIAVKTEEHSVVPLSCHPASARNATSCCSRFTSTLLLITRCHGTCWSRQGSVALDFSFLAKSHQTWLYLQLSRDMAYLMFFRCGAMT